MKTNTPESNTQFLTRLMEFSSTGAMSQLVILTGIEHYVDAVLADPVKFKESMKDNDFISAEGWLRACREIKRDFETRRSSR